MGSTASMRNVSNETPVMLNIDHKIHPALSQGKIKQCKI